VSDTGTKSGTLWGQHLFFGNLVLNFKLEEFEIFLSHPHYLSESLTIQVNKCEIILIKFTCLNIF
jgi:hypothetical protein